MDVLSHVHYYIDSSRRKDPAQSSGTDAKNARNAGSLTFLGLVRFTQDTNSKICCSHFRPTKLTPFSNTKSGPLVAVVDSSKQQQPPAMDYHRSTQARSWTFDKDSLLACKQRAVAATDNEVTTLSNVDTTQSIKDPNNGVQKFASGFHQRCREAQPADSSKKQNMHSYVSVGDHDLLVQFHAHQIQTLIGPAAIIPELRTSETVLSTAVIFFRRFFLSNTTILIHPRNIAVACAFLAAKVEEERVQVRTMPRSPFQRGKPRSAIKPTRKCQQNFAPFKFSVMRFFCRILSHKWRVCSF